MGYLKRNAPTAPAMTGRALQPLGDRQPESLLERFWSTTAPARWSALISMSAPGGRREHGYRNRQRRLPESIGFRANVGIYEDSFA